ncbi:hypothetical protein VVD49_19110 [Uliginosibacterium sp. H3]|uniref:Uncharacterized protein n=1 Tax=Uliginosibacterium silvisoli TaxID=3114758 RepID=A0ABU6K810_9RHOO|nr:hypothetical protein [Uliginosibacterium sp. H3]
MLKYVWLLVLTIPPWAAAEFGASKWVVGLALAPFFILAMTYGDPDEDQFGEASGAFRKGALIALFVGAIVLVTVLFILWRVFFPGAPVR